MSYDYAGWQQAMIEMLGVTDEQGQQLFATITPRMIEFAELAIYRDMQLRDTTVTAYFPTTAQNRNLFIPAGTYVVVDTANLITPAGQTPDFGKRNPLRRVTNEFLNMFCPSADGATLPAYYDMFLRDRCLLGPWPDDVYNIEFIGTFRPLPLGDGSDPTTSQTTTLLTEDFPDLFLTACMIFGAGYQKNFGAQADDPKMAISWTAVYQEQLKSAKMEEAMKKAAIGNWQAYPPAQAVPPLS